MRPPEPAVALVFSPEVWVEELHRHLSHHGGARVRQIVVEPSVALDEQYDVLVVSDRWPALTLGLVGAVHSRGRSVLGVFDPEEPAGQEHLVALGVDATLASDATVDDFVAALHELSAETVLGAPGHDQAVLPSACDGASPGVVVAVSGPRGSGVTEVALGVASALAERERSVLLVDANEVAPALAGRLGLGLEPNLGTAVDACSHGIGQLADCVRPVAARGGARIDALAGHPSAIAAARVSTHDVLDVVRAAAHEHDFVVIDVDESSPTSRAVVERADAVVGVVHASPVGVVRGIEWMLVTVGRGAPAPLHVVVNHAPRSRFRQEEIRTEIERTIRPSFIDWCPDDEHVVAAAWDGVPVARGDFRAACARLGAAFAPTPRPRWWRRGR